MAVKKTLKNTARNFKMQFGIMSKQGTERTKNFNRVFTEARKKGDSVITAIKKSEKVAKMDRKNSQGTLDFLFKNKKK